MRNAVSVKVIKICNFAKTSASLASCILLLGGCSQQTSTPEESRPAGLIPEVTEQDVRWCNELGKSLKNIDAEDLKLSFLDQAALKAFHFSMCLVIKTSYFLNNPAKIYSGIGDAIKVPQSGDQQKQKQLKGAIGAEVTAKITEITPYVTKVMTEANIPADRLTAQDVTRVALAAIAYDSKALNRHSKGSDKHLLIDLGGNEISSDEMEKAWVKWSGPFTAFNLVGAASSALSTDFSQMSRAQVLTYVVKSTFGLNIATDPLIIKDTYSAVLLNSWLKQAAEIYTK